MGALPFCSSWGLCAHFLWPPDRWYRRASAGSKGGAASAPLGLVPLTGLHAVTPPAPSQTHVPPWDLQEPSLLLNLNTWQETLLTTPCRPRGRKWGEVKFWLLMLRASWKDFTKPDGHWQAWYGVGEVRVSRAARRKAKPDAGPVELVGKSFLSMRLDFALSTLEATERL